MKITLVATVFNEEKTIRKFLDSIFSQKKKPNEIIIVDGGSTDKTVSLIKKMSSKIKVIIKKGNRSIGRNEGIKRARGDIIALSDAGCILDKNWLFLITNPFKNKKTQVVAGYYKGISKSIFQKCLIPYVLVMPDKVKNDEFLPASRSMAFRKEIWEKLGGFNKRYSHNEDYVFAQKLKKHKISIHFESKAIVYWLPRTNIVDAFKMFFRFAIGDVESGIIRGKVLLIFARYLLFIYFLFLAYVYKSTSLILFVLFLSVMYVLWSIKKNYGYVDNVRAYFYLPLIQFTSDSAVLLGSIVGLFTQLQSFNIYSFLKRHKLEVGLISFYVCIVLSQIQWGIPNETHPFLYHMDEWHQLQAVRGVFKYGTPNMEGAANGTMFHFFVSGVLLAPFVLLKFVNPFAIKSSVESLDLQQNLFLALRLNTLFFGILSTILVGIIARGYFKINSFIAVFLFTITPAWLVLSGYFKYDIALIFWILLSLFFILRYAKDQTPSNFILASFTCALCLSVKISALPIYGVLFISYLIFTKEKLKDMKTLVIGSLIFLFTFLLLGIPDIIFGKGNLYEYFYSNVFVVPGNSENFVLDKPYWQYALFSIFPMDFGHVFSLLFAASLLYWIYTLFKAFKEKKIRDYKQHLFLFLSFALFAISLIPLKIYFGGNRALVLLPFMAFMSGYFLKQIYQKNKRSLLLVFLSILMLVQIFESISWVYIKWQSSPQEKSSKWVEKNIPHGQVIGLENIPIYQQIPNNLLKEFYNKQYNLPIENRYNYEIVDSKSPSLPKTIVITNGQASLHFEKESSKKDLLARLEKEHYKKSAEFNPDFTLFHIFGTERDFFFAPLVAVPLSIEIYEKN